MGDTKKLSCMRPFFLCDLLELHKLWAHSEKDIHVAHKIDYFAYEMIFHGRIGKKLFAAPIKYFPGE